jgi:hypothetical protein
VGPEQLPQHLAVLQSIALHGPLMFKAQHTICNSITQRRACMQTSYDEPAGPNIADSVAWQDLSSHVPEIEQTHLKSLLKDEKRTDMLTVSNEGVYADFSRQRVTNETLRVRARATGHGYLRCKCMCGHCDQMHTDLSH